MNLKKFFFLILIVFNGAFYAQENLSYGLKFGLNLADMITDESKLGPRSSFQFGFEGEYRLNKQWGLQAEILYSRQGNVRRGRTAEGLKFDNTLLLDYINFPLLLNYYINDGFYVNAGPQIGVLVRAEQEDTVLFDSNRESVRRKYDDLDFSGVFGIGYLTNWGFNVGLRYQQGLMNVLKEDLGYTNSQIHSVYQLYLSVRF